MPQKNKILNIVEPKHVKRKVIITVCILIIVAIPIDIYFTGFARYAYTVVKCGRLPARLSPAGLWSYSTTYIPAGKYTPGGARTQYYCSSQSAIEAGLTRDPLIP